VEHSGKIQTETIEALQAALKQNELESHELFLSSSELSQHLFAKATPNYLQTRTLEQLVDISSRAHNHLKKFLDSSESPLVRTEIAKDHCKIFVSIGDRPFIINSLRECLVNFEVSISILLHPILNREGHRISFSYIEISPLSGEQLNVLQRRLEQTLAHVTFATEDFNATIVQVETLARLLESNRTSSHHTAAERKELGAFLRWLIDGGYVFLGHIRWEVKQKPELSLGKYSTLGVGRADDNVFKSFIQEASQDATSLLTSDSLFAISRLRTESLVQRRNQITALTVQEHSSDGHLIAIHLIAGLFTSKALAEDSSSIPIIREKLRKLLELEMVVEQSHDHKSIVNVIDSMPKDEALRADIESLRVIVRSVLDIQNRNETRVSVRFDQSFRGASILIILPRDRFNSGVRQRLQKHIEHVFGAISGSSEYLLDLSSRPHARIYFQLPLPEGEPQPVDLAKLESDIADLTRSWQDNLQHAIATEHQAEISEQTWSVYGNAFPEDYQALYSVQECKHDIENIKLLSPLQSYKISMLPAKGVPPGFFTLVVYSLTQEVTISRALPVLENAGLEVINEQTNRVVPAGRDPVYIHRFLVRGKFETYITQETFQEFLAPGLERIFSGEVENDLLNSLLVSANLDTRAIALLRAYCGFLWQVNKFASTSVILDAVASHPSAANQLWNMFEIRFDPCLTSELESRQARFQSALTHFRDSLRSVSDITQDRILRGLADILANTVRTNFYQNSEAICLKVQSSKVESIPAPRPMFEIYVHSSTMEGVHLRAGKIARGGLRWSDRHQDFRSEVLGLMKTQNIKNALIVPAGAKGGFVVRQAHVTDREQQIELVKSAYKTFIRSLLCITDNRKNGEIVRPDRVIAYDEEDPYLVVAADKGTATFSDIANKIAVEEFDFWLGDAFASGGSQGYDHKLYGITAKGAWESVLRHFKNIGLDYLQDTFSAVGVGDMSGDVFGNGLLLSDQVKLIAAFNHKHIFLDPSPDPAISFAERKRLFELPTSQWCDYNSALISKGGGIYNRFEKEITLSPEAREALGLDSDYPSEIDGETLISLILKAPCDLLWNGGIGTYVKSKAESNADVNDGTNDRVRVNADELRARVVGEGGNLGFTQRARIDFARRGGHIFTDAIDNSAGVDLSDHEVNIKILLSEIVQSGMLPVEERNALLKVIADEVIDDVLQHNRNHALLLTIAVRRSRRSIEYFATLLREIVKRGYVSRSLEFLPEDDELLERARKREGLTRPELAICLGAVKMWVKDELVKSQLPTDPLLKSFLVGYFPDTLKDRFSEQILTHPLAHHIIATQATNILIDSVGITFVHRMCLSHSVNPITVIKCALAADMLLGARKLRKAIRQFDTYQHNKLFMELMEELNGALRDLTLWLIGCHGHDLTLREIVDLYKEQFRQANKLGPQLLAGEDRELLTLRQRKYIELNLNQSAATTFALLPKIMTILETLWASQRAEESLEKVAAIYSDTLQLLGLNSILQLEFSTDAKNKWEHELLANAFWDIRRSVSNIVISMIKTVGPDLEQIHQLLTDSQSYQQLRLVLSELKGEDPGIAVFPVISRLLQNYHLGTRLDQA